MWRHAVRARSGGAPEGEGEVALAGQQAPDLAVALPGQLRLQVKPGRHGGRLLDVFALQLQQP